ncbi:MAG: cupin fold metalloprotein, WbuC family [Synechococcus sp. XM-24]|nr:MAG: cupin fold metalloprotein, WbuC family [Synechococcus sp. XM-24]
MTSPGLQLIDQDLFDAVALRARASERLRMNFNLHQESDLVQRFLNVMQPGTYVRPHRHCRPGTGEGFECFVVLQGSIGVLLFDANGTCLRQERLDAAGPVRGLQLDEGLFHSLVALAPDSVIFELKKGPYQPLADKDFLAGFPQEGELESGQQELEWRRSFDV